MCSASAQEKPTLETTSKPMSSNIRVADAFPVLPNGVMSPIRVAP